jgi:hypothetical protein
MGPSAVDKLEYRFVPGAHRPSLTFCVVEEAVERDCKISGPAFMGRNAMAYAPPLDQTPSEGVCQLDASVSARTRPKLDD